MRRVRKAMVIGLDGLDPARVDRLLAAGFLPHLDALRKRGGFDRVSTTTPAQTPVAWSTFATGVNPGVHGIFDFIRRDPRTYQPSLALSRHEQRSALLPPVAVNLRGGVPLWQHLGAAGIPSTVIRCPCTYPPDRIKGRMLAGMGVPDLRGGVGTATILSDAEESPREGEDVVMLATEDGECVASLHGPWNPVRRAHAVAPVQVSVTTEGRVTLRSGKAAASTVAGEWSEWLPVRFSTGRLTRAAGLVRFRVLSLRDPLRLYVTPVNFDPAAPLFPISHPWEYAQELRRAIGPYHTTGFVEDHNGLLNDRLSESEFLSQCDDAMRERRAMMRFELGRFTEGLLFCLFDTPDRIQHMFWRFEEPGHPANRDHATDAAFSGVIDDHYRACDEVVGEVLGHADDETLCIVLSDHGFGSFQRGVNLNAWLHDAGWLALKPGHSADEPVDFLHSVDWTRTRAYALGMGSIYFNVRGREGEGIVEPAHLPLESSRLASQLSHLADPDRHCPVIRSVGSRSALYAGERAHESPDLVVGFERGYRVSWATVLGGIGGSIVEDNMRRWGGDHIVDPSLVPGALFMNRPFASGARLHDLAPTILTALGVPIPAAMEGRCLLS